MTAFLVFREKNSDAIKQTSHSADMERLLTLQYNLQQWHCIPTASIPKLSQIYLSPCLRPPLMNPGHFCLEN